MRFQILAFAGGVGLLQTQESLPAMPVIVGAFLVAAALVLVLAQRPNRLCRLLTLLACLVLGYGWAALRAEQRLRDHLPAAWEGVDVQLVGVVAALP